MSSQIDLLDWRPETKARRDDPETSHDAARLAEGLAIDHRRAILQAMQPGDGTAEEVAWRCGLDTHQVNRRVGELLAAGLVELTGETRVNLAGRRMRVFHKPAVA